MSKSQVSRLAARLDDARRLERFVEILLDMTRLAMARVLSGQPPAEILGGIRS